MLVKLMAKLIFERAVMSGMFTGSPVFTKSTKFILFGDADHIMIHRDNRPLINSILIGVSLIVIVSCVVIWHDSQP